MLSCRNLTLEYPDGEKTKVVLDEIDLDIKEGEKVILFGPSGSGKSSLIYLLSTLRKPTSGEIFLDKINLVDSKNITDIRKKKFGFIFQMHFLIPYLNVLENVLTASNSNTTSSRKKAMGILKKLGIDQYKNRYIYQLSGGERQRVAIARALMNDPDIIFADEPTASLDHKTANEVINILKNYKKNSILIMATHDTSILEGDERVIKIIDGKTFEERKGKKKESMK